MNDAEAARAADRARIVAIDAEILQLQEQIRLLQLEKECFRGRLDTYRYPVLTLPNEITSEIFVHFPPRYPDCPRLSGLKSPTTLTHVCRKWREIALATPKLWRAFSVDIDEEYDEAERLGVMQAWLDRSGSCPFSMELVTHAYGDDEAPNGYAAPSEYLTTTLLHRERWQHAQLHLAAEEVALIQGPMPLLESLSLTVGDLAYTHPAASASDFPRLRSATLSDADHGNWLPLSQLTTLTLKQVCDTNYLALLQAAVNLVHLYLIDCTPPRSGSGSPTTFTRLETLVVKDYLCLPKTLDMFTLPALRGLQWSGGVWGHPLIHFGHINSVTSLISRSGCKLQQVLFTGRGPVSEASLRAALRPYPPFRKSLLIVNMTGTPRHARDSRTDSGCDLDSDLKRFLHVPNASSERVFRSSVWWESTREQEHEVVCNRNRVRDVCVRANRCPTP
ncbi:hypothetical protein FB45DRAFT_999997 [Roridomyces roridus]|uniref:F-box domain-containing protein n=1 Tax=Roridomyces roridus TaxID=1738132 RepID=A0AAD7FVA6_9AGAR|nr:hypothetical protein FB45DRAFT_999997 [Roridomyces roridus]